jgi:rhodanese-related sulfurtransferase
LADAPRFSILLKTASSRCLTSLAEATISVAGLSALLRAKAQVTVLDARAGKWDDGKRIPGAKSLNAGSTDEEIRTALPDKNALVVTYCSGVKCPASGMLAKRLHEAGYANVVELPEGIAGWTEAGNSVEERR